MKVNRMRIWPAKRTVKRWGIGAGILLGALLVVNGFFSWRVNSQFNAKIAAIRAEGAPASIADLNPKPIPAEINAAAHIDALAPRLDEFGKEQYRWESKTPLGQSYEKLNEGESPTPEQLAAMREILDKYADLEAAISAAAACPQYASTADFSLGFHDFLDSNLNDRISRIRAIARLVRWRSRVLIGEGRPDLAVERWIEVLRLAKLHEAEPTVVAQLVTYAVRYATVDGIHEALMAGPIPPELRDQLNAELARVESPTKMKDVLIAERAVSASASVEQTSSTCGPDGCVPAPRVLVWLFGWVPKRFYLAPFDLYDELLPIADKPWPEIKPLFAKGGKLNGSTGHGVLADLLFPALEAAISAANRDTAFARSLRVYSDLQHFAEENDREATGLDELSLPKEATIDPFSGKPLIVQNTDAGWLVYSVGADGIDGGGNFDEHKDVGVGPPRPAPTDDVNG